MMNQSSTKKSTRASIECKICGAPAIYSYFGVISCHSCKMFFKRNAEQEKKVLKCNFNSHCEVNMTNRHICSYCRLKKCLTNGMQIELLRSCQSKMSKRNRKRKIMTKSNNKTPTTVGKCDEDEQFPTMNILQSDQPTLNIDQWNLLSNLVHCYDEYSGVSLAEHFVYEQNTLPLKLRFKNASVRKFIASLLSETRLLFEKNPDFSSLSSHDRSILLHYSTKYITILSASFIGRQARLLTYPSFLQSTETLVGPSTMTIIKRLIDQLDFDITFIKLILSILSFSTTNYTINKNTDSTNLINTTTIIHIHDRYIELAWRYLLYKYDYHQTVIYFSKLLNCLFMLNAILVEVHEGELFTHIIDSVVNQIKQTVVHDD